MKDEKYSTEVKDQHGFPSFALVNKATLQGMKHSIEAHHPVCLSVDLCSIDLYNSLAWIFISSTRDKFQCLVLQG